MTGPKGQVSHIDVDGPKFCVNVASGRRGGPFPRSFLMFLFLKTKNSGSLCFVISSSWEPASSDTIAHAECGRIPASGNSSPLRVILTPRKEGPTLAPIQMSPTSWGTQSAGTIGMCPPSLCHPPDHTLSTRDLWMSCPCHSPRPQGWARAAVSRASGQSWGGSFQVHVWVQAARSSVGSSGLGGCKGWDRDLGGLLPAGTSESGKSRLTPGPSDCCEVCLSGEENRAY